METDFFFLLISSPHKCKPLDLMTSDGKCLKIYHEEELHQQYYISKYEEVLSKRNKSHADLSFFLTFVLINFTELVQHTPGCGLVKWFPLKLFNCWAAPPHTHRHIFSECFTADTEHKSQIVFCKDEQYPNICASIKKKKKIRTSNMIQSNRRRLCVYGNY